MSNNNTPRFKAIKRAVERELAKSFKCRIKVTLLDNQLLVQMFYKGIELSRTICDLHSYLDPDVSIDSTLIAFKIKHNLRDSLSYALYN